MKKIPTLFVREFENHRVVKVLPEVTPGMEWVLNGEGVATEKIDGACCAIIDGVFYKRYDAKLNKNGKRKLPPVGSIPCDYPDPVTGHWPHWTRVDEAKPEDKWYVKALHNSLEIVSSICIDKLEDGTYEVVGPHFQNNPYGLERDILRRHGTIVLDLEDRSFEGIRDYLASHPIEGIVFWRDGKPQCKIKRSDFGFEWPIKNRVDS